MSDTIHIEQPPTNFIQQAFESFPENSVIEVQCAGSKTTTLFLNVRNDKRSLLQTIKELKERLDAMSGITPIKILDAGNPLEDKYYGPGYFSPAKPKNNE